MTLTEKKDSIMAEARKMQEKQKALQEASKKDQAELKAMQQERFQVILAEMEKNKVECP